MKCSKCRGIDVFDSDGGIWWWIICHLQIIPMSHSQIIRKRCKKDGGKLWSRGGSDSNLMRLFSRGVRIKSSKQNYHTCLLLVRYRVSHSSMVIIIQLHAHLLGITCHVHKLVSCSLQASSEVRGSIPWMKWKEDGTDSSSRAVKRLLRHRRNIFCIDGLAQRIANLILMHNNRIIAYLVSTMQWIYEEQLISDAFATDDAFVDRILISRSVLIGSWQVLKPWILRTWLDFSWNKQWGLDFRLINRYYELDSGLYLCPVYLIFGCYPQLVSLNFLGLWLIVLNGVH